MTLPEWAEDKIDRAIERTQPIANGKVILIVELNFSNEALGGMDVDVRYRESHRPPKEDKREMGQFNFKG